jgi:hypothetical protein
LSTRSEQGGCYHESSGEGKGECAQQRHLTAFPYLDIAEKIADIIIFGTHGRAGLDAFWNRSVAASVARRTKIPLLLISLPE